MNLTYWIYIKRDYNLNMEEGGVGGWFNLEIVQWITRYKAILISSVKTCLILSLFQNT